MFEWLGISVHVLKQQVSILYEWPCGIYGWVCIISSLTLLANFQLDLL